MKERREQREHRRYPANGTARDLTGSQIDQCALTVTNFSREGIGINIPHDYNLIGSNELELQVQVLRDMPPVRISGTLKWFKVLEGDEDFAMTGGVECKEIDPIQRWRHMIYHNEGLPI